MATINKRETKTGKVRWDAQVYIGRHPTTGRHQFISKTFERKTDAEKWARSKEVRKDRNERLSTTKTTLAEWLREWLVAHGQNVRDVTIYNYRATVNKWILDPPPGAPLIGSRPLAKLTVHDFDRLYRYLSETGLRPRGVQTLHEILRPALKAAVKKGLITQNPIDYATLPKENAKGEEEETDAAQARAMSRDEAEAFLAAAESDRHAALWYVLMTGGLRPCEAFALKWENVDFEAGGVHVERSLSRLGVDRKRHPLGWKLTIPKTPKSRRFVTLPQVTMRHLARWRKLQAWERRIAQGEYQDHGFVFTTEVGSPLDGSNLYRGSFRRICEAAGLGEYGPEPEKPKSGPRRKRPFTPAFRIYDLRHTHATLLLMDGEELLVVSRRLGHSTVTLTADTYASVTRERNEGVATRLDAMFGT